MKWVGLNTLFLLMELVASASVSSTTPRVEVKTNRTYQVTENIVDVPDNRTVRPIIANFTLNTPLNLGNSTIVHANRKNASEERNSKEGSSEDHSDSNVGDNCHKLRKTSISILHIKAETDNKPTRNQSGISKVFGGIKDYFYSIKKGVVDGLHSYFNKEEKTEQGNGGHRSFDEDFHRDYHDEEFDDDSDCCDYY